LSLALRALLSAAGAMTGFLSGKYIITWMAIPLRESLYFIFCCVLAGVLAIIFFAAAGYILRAFESFYDRAERTVKGLTVVEAGIAFAGLVAGLAVSFFITLPITKSGWLGLSITICVNFLFGYIGLAFALWKRHDFSGTMQRQGGKLLDTSVIIDGRIVDIIKTGFLDGLFVIPEFVLEELRHIADSADSFKRAKGRRGLDILNSLRNELGQMLIVDKTTLPEGVEVDAELVRVAQRNGYIILTTDYNLNKVTTVQGVKVLNINELNNAIKPIAMPGEELSVQIVRDGREAGQGVAYLPDGTMVVVEGGKPYLGETVAVTLTSVLQTAAGRMIFAKPR
jgi:uncharacterized protein YacL